MSAECGAEPADHRGTPARRRRWLPEASRVAPNLAAHNIVQDTTNIPHSDICNHLDPYVTFRSVDAPFDRWATTSAGRRPPHVKTTRLLLRNLN